MTRQGYEALIVSFSTSALINAIIAPCGGFLADTVGRKPLLLLSATLFAVGTVLIATSFHQFSPSIGAIIILTSPAMAGGAYNSLISESVPRDLRGRIFSIGLFASFTGMSMRSTIFGFLMERVGLSSTLSMVAILATTGAVLRLAIVETKKKVQPRVDNRPPVLDAVRELFLSRELAPLTAMNLIMGFIGQLFYIFLTIYLSKVIGFNAEAIGLTFSTFIASQAVGQLVSGTFVDRYGEVKALILDVLASAPSTVLFIILPMAAPALLPILLTPNAFFSAFTTTALFTYVARTVHENRRATVYGFLISMSNLSSLPAPVVGTILWTYIPQSVFPPYIILAFALLPLILMLKRTNEADR